MSENGFVDYYEILQLSSNADIDTIERVFRHLAKKYHPDHTQTADDERFRLILEAYQVLSNLETRAGYDVRYQEFWNSKWHIASEASRGDAFCDDKETREGLMSLLYVQRRRNMNNPGMGEYEMARLLSKPLELVEFHVWYLKAKGWVERIDTGQLAISALGVDQVEQGRLRLNSDHLLAAPHDATDDRDGQMVRSQS